ncbi:uncharacterized protein LOC113791817 isoform X3 [Dermatophagoides pteronyssinus]
MKPIKLPLKKKTPLTQPQPQKQQQPIVKNNKKTNATDTPLPPPPPPPPLPELGNQIVPPPPPPPNSLLNKGQTTTNKKAINNKVVTNENKTNIVKPKADLAINKKELADSPKRTAKSDMVDETPIKVAAQKKLWESAHNKQPEINNVQNKKPVKVKAAQPQAIQPIAKPSPPVTQSQPQQPDIAIKAPNKGPVRSNKLGTWEKCPSSTPVSTPVTNSKADIASPEPKKKITIKKKDVNNNIINNNESGQPRRSTRDLSSTIESSATDSNSSTPFSSPGTQRRQMYYGRRTSTQPIASEQQQPQQQQPVASRKPTWGLRDQVDNLIETTPSSTPTRCRSPALVPTPRDSHSPSPQPAGIAGSGKKVFGRVPPRRTSLSGNGAVGQNNLTNDFVPISPPPPPIMVFDDSIAHNNNIEHNVDRFLHKPLSMMIDRINFSRSPSPINSTNKTNMHVDHLPVNYTHQYENHLQQPYFDRSTSLSAGHLDHNSSSQNYFVQQPSFYPKRSSSSSLLPPQSKPEFQPQNRKFISWIASSPQKQPENHSYVQQPQIHSSTTKTLSEQQQQARDFIQQQLEAPMNFAPLIRRHTTNDRIWANRNKSSTLPQQQPIHTPIPTTQKIMNGCQPVDQRSATNVPFDSNQRDRLAHSMFLQQIEPSFGRQAITPPPGRMFNYNERSQTAIGNGRPISPNILMRSSLPKITENNDSMNVSSSPWRLVSDKSTNQPMNSYSNTNLYNSNNQQMQPKKLVVIQRSPESHENICFATDY